MQDDRLPIPFPTQTAQTIVIIGGGVVGSNTAKGLKKMHPNYRVVVCDKNPTRIHELITEGLEAIAPEHLTNVNADIFFVSVDTPYLPGEGWFLGNLEAATLSIGEAMKSSGNYQLVVFRSTVPPGTTRSLIPLLERSSGKVAGTNFGVCFHPEYLRAKSAEEDFLKPNLIVIAGMDERSENTLSHLYTHLGKVMTFVNFETAEATKLVNNALNATTISFFNDLRTSFEQLNPEINPQQAFEIATYTAEASYNRQYGIRPMGPYAGECLPKDTNGLRDFLYNNDIESLMLEATTNVNRKLGGS